MNKEKSLSKYVARVMQDKNLSGYDVERRANRRITQSFVNRIKTGEVKNPSADKLQALATGLAVSEEELFAVVRGVSTEPTDFQKAILSAFHDAENWTVAEREMAVNFARVFADGIRAKRKS